MVPAHLGQVFVWLIGHHGLDPVGVAIFTKSAAPTLVWSIGTTTRALPVPWRIS